MEEYDDLEQFTLTDQDHRGESTSCGVVLLPVAPHVEVKREQQKKADEKRRVFGAFERASNLLTEPTKASESKENELRQKLFDDAKLNQEK